jgi:hypothetical protein
MFFQTKSLVKLVSSSWLPSFTTTQRRDYQVHCHCQIPNLIHLEANILQYSRSALRRTTGRSLVVTCGLRDAGEYTVHRGVTVYYVAVITHFNSRSRVKFKLSFFLLANACAKSVLSESWTTRNACRVLTVSIFFFCFDHNAGTAPIII